MSLEVDSLSRFKDTEALVKDNVETFGLWVRPDFLKPGNLKEEEIITISVDQKFAGRPDTISQEYYNTPYLEWVVIMFNKPLNTVGWPEAGSVIRIPVREQVIRGI